MKKEYNEFLKKNGLVNAIVDSIASAGGHALLVGGAVRDLLMGNEFKDIDIEVYGLQLEQLETVLKTFGPVSFVGKSFGVFRLHGLDVDWSLPRSDSSGRKPTVSLDPFMSYKQAFARRDVTINAIGINMHTGELVDPFGGVLDIKRKILRSPNITFFDQDPLRFYRVMQFVARFDMQPDGDLMNVCMHMDISTVSKERIEQECTKLLLRSASPSLGFRWVYKTGRLQEVFPQLADCIGVPQDPSWHPEGDVFEHTMQTLDAAAQIVQKYVDEEKKLVLLYAALCHDMGKKETTQKINGIYKSIEHARVGAKKTKEFLALITSKKNNIIAAAKLVEFHMYPMQFVCNNAKKNAYKKLAYKLAPHATLQMLADLVLADKRGRNEFSLRPLQSDFDDIQFFIQKSKDAHVFDGQESPLLQGKDIMHMVSPGPQMGSVLEYAYSIQLDQDISDKQTLLAIVEKYVKSL